MQQEADQPTGGYDPKWQEKGWDHSRVPARGPPHLVCVGMEEGSPEKEASECRLKVKRMQVKTGSSEGTWARPGGSCEEGEGG